MANSTRCFGVTHCKNYTSKVVFKSNKKSFYISIYSAVTLSEVVFLRIERQFQFFLTNCSFMPFSPTTVIRFLCEHQFSVLEVFTA